MHIDYRLRITTKTFTVFISTKALLDENVTTPEDRNKTLTSVSIKMNSTTHTQTQYQTGILDRSSSIPPGAAGLIERARWRQEGREGEPQSITTGSVHQTNIQVGWLLPAQRPCA